MKLDLLKSGLKLIRKSPEMRLKHGQLLECILKRYETVKMREPKQLQKTGSDL
jgi:hypothetical protein